MIKKLYKKKLHINGSGKLKKKILLIGANGYLGKCIYKYFKKNFNIIKFNESKKPRKDIRRIEDLYKLKKKNIKFDIIINLAGQISESLEKTMSENLVGTSNLIKVFQNNEKIIFFSTYALNNFKKSSNISAVKKNYLSSKSLAEKLIIKNVRDYIIIRLGNVYDSTFSKKGLIKNLKLHFLKNKKISITDAKEVNSYIHIDDFMDAFRLILQKKEKKKKFNLATENHTNYNLYKIFKNFYHKKNKCIKTKVLYNKKNSKMTVLKKLISIKETLEKNK